MKYAISLMVNYSCLLKKKKKKFWPQVTSVSEWHSTYIQLILHFYTRHLYPQICSTKTIYIFGMCSWITVSLALIAGHLDVPGELCNLHSQRIPRLINKNVLKAVSVQNYTKPLFFFPFCFSNIKLKTRTLQINIKQQDQFKFKYHALLLTL